MKLPITILLIALFVGGCGGEKKKEAEVSRIDLIGVSVDGVIDSFKNKKIMSSDWLDEIYPKILEDYGGVPQGTQILNPTEDGSVLVIFPDNTLKVYGNPESIIKDLWERQRTAWNRYGELQKTCEKIIKTK